MWGACRRRASAPARCRNGRTADPTATGQQHQGYQAVQGTGWSIRLTTWTRIPGTGIDVRALATTPLALR